MELCVIVFALVILALCIGTKSSERFLSLRTSAVEGCAWPSEIENLQVGYPVLKVRLVGVNFSGTPLFSRNGVLVQPLLFVPDSNNLASSFVFYDSRKVPNQYSPKPEQEVCSTSEPERVSETETLFGYPSKLKTFSDYGTPDSEVWEVEITGPVIPAVEGDLKLVGVRKNFGRNILELARA